MGVRSPASRGLCTPPAWLGPASREENNNMDIGKFVDRRMHPVRVAMHLMNHELELNRNDQMVSLDRETLRSLVETFQIFIEDFESSYRATKDLAQKKFVSATPGAPATKVG
jgi:hypothetical protein